MSLPNFIIEISIVLLFTLNFPKVQEYCISYHRSVDILCRQTYGDGQFQKFARI